MRNLTLEACSCFKHSHGGLHGGEHWYDGCGGLKVGTEMSGGIENVRIATPDPAPVLPDGVRAQPVVHAAHQITFEDSHISYAGAALKMLSPTGRGGYIRNATWRGITADESGGLLWLQISNASADPAENARVSQVSRPHPRTLSASCRCLLASFSERRLSMPCR